MNIIIVEPRQGIGAIKLGMGREEIRKYAEANGVRLYTPRRSASEESFGDY